MIEKLINFVQEKKKNKNFVTYILMACVIFLIISVVVIYNYISGRKVALMMHERDVLLESKHQLEVKQELTEIDDKREDIRNDLIVVDKKIDELSKKVVQEEMAMNSVLNALGKVRNWDDVDKIILNK